MPDTLKLTIEREVKPSEVASMIYGTGALSWGWWHSATWNRPPHHDTPMQPVEGAHMLEDDSEYHANDIVVFIVDDPDEPEGSGKTVRIWRTVRQIVEAASRAIRGDGAHIDDESAHDMAYEDLGYADAIAGDAVLQLAVFGEIRFG